MLIKQTTNKQKKIRKEGKEGKRKSTMLSHALISALESRDRRINLRANKH